MKLYVSPGACSMSCHIAFEEAGLKFEPMISKSEEVEKLNPMGAVPVLVFDDGKVLTQNIAILTYAATQNSGAHLLPKSGTPDFWKTYQWLSWVASDLHPTFHALWDEDAPASEKTEATKDVLDLLSQPEKELAGKQYIAGSQFTIADAYLFAVFGWTRFLKIDTSSLRNLNTYAARIAERPAVQQVMKREGLV